MKEDIISRFLPVVEKEYPGVTESDIQFYDDGFDHYVFVLNNTHAIRFPRSEENGKRDTVENAFLSQFAAQSLIPVQNMTGHTDEETGIHYQTYEFLPGVAFTRERAMQMTVDERLSIAKQLGEFLTTLHSFPLEKAQKIRMESLVSPADYGAYFKAVIEKDKPFIRPYVTESEWEWVAQLLLGFYEITQKKPFPFTVTHSDLLEDHILIDEQTKKVASIIDFSLRIADAAYDFRIFADYGDDFLKTVYDNYLPTDDYFDIRRKFYAADMRVANVYLAVTRNESNETLEKRVQELKGYIATNSLPWSTS